MKNFLWGIILLTACNSDMAAPTSPKCEDIYIQYRAEVDSYIVWWRPTLDPTHAGALVSVNGQGVKWMCRRNDRLQNSSTGTWSFFVEAGDEVCIDYDYIVTDNDCECLSKAE